MNINWKEIKQKYPLAYDAFIKSNGMFEYTNKDKCENCDVLCKGGMLTHSWCQKDYVCYCDLEKLFDDNGIEIAIVKTIEFGTETFDYKIYDEFLIYESEFENKTRPEAKEAAIYKDFEILNEKLKDK